MTTAEKTAAPEYKNVNLMLIQRPSETQMRVNGTDPKLVDEYAEAMSNGEKFPPLVLFKDGKDLYLVEGFHRYEAAEKAGKKSLPCEVHFGTLREAILHAVRANAAHGQRRTQADKRRAVETLLNDPEWSHWSNNQVAKQARVSPMLVADIKAEREAKNPVLTISSYSENGDSEHKNGENGSQNGVTTYVTKHGKIATMKTGNIGKKATKNEPQEIGQIAADGTMVLKQDTPDYDSDDVFSDDSNDPIGQPETAPQQTTEADLTDDEWLETLPLFNALAPYPNNQAIFKAGALSYRTFTQSGLLGKIKNAAQVASRFAQNFTATTPDFVNAAKELGKWKHPGEWELCPKCRGCGQFWMNNQTKQHEDAGTVPSDSSNEYALRCTLTNCTCTGGHVSK